MKLVTYFVTIENEKALEFPCTDDVEVDANENEAIKMMSMAASQECTVPDKGEDHSTDGRKRVTLKGSEGDVNENRATEVTNMVASRESALPDEAAKDHCTDGRDRVNFEGLDEDATENGPIKMTKVAASHESAFPEAGEYHESRKIVNVEKSRVSFACNEDVVTDANDTVDRMKAIQKDRLNTLHHPMTMDMHRRTRLKMKSGEVAANLTFFVPSCKLLELPPSIKEPSNDSTVAMDRIEPIASVRETFYRRFESLHPSRKEDDVPYLDAVETGYEVLLITPLPQDYKRGGWRCHALSFDSVDSEITTVKSECLHPNGPNDDRCRKCSSTRPNLKPEFAYLRLMSPGIREQRNEYMKIIIGNDFELGRIEAAESEARERIAAAAERDTNRIEGNQGNETQSTLNCDLESCENEEVNAEQDLPKTVNEQDCEEDQDPLMMNVDLVQKGVWQQVNAKDLLPILEERKSRAQKLLADARKELQIMVHTGYEIAVVHAQKIIRGYLLRVRLERIRQSVLDLAKYSAAVEIQRIARSILATREKRRERRRRDSRMATRIQSLVRQRLAVRERKRRWKIYMDMLRNKAATKIQSLYRCRTSRKMAETLQEERRRHLEEVETARVASLEKDSATIIQKYYRRCLCKVQCANRRIELGLHGRLLMYLERYMVDGCMWSFVKSINDDYVRYERTITNTIEREEKMAKTFVDKVINVRDVDHSDAWDQYFTLKEKDRTPEQSAKRTDQDKDIEIRPGLRKGKFVQPKSMIQKVILDDIEERKPKTNDGREWERRRTQNTAKIYGNRTRPLIKSPQSKKNREKNIKFETVYEGDEQVDKLRAAAAARSFQSSRDAVVSSDFVIPSDTYNCSWLHQNHRQEVKRLVNLHRAKNRLRGQYVRFDIPDNLDDTVVRFITAVAFRYNFESPKESSLHGNFVLSSFDRKECSSAKEYSSALIRSLHKEGIIFIRQLLPVEKMHSILLDLGVEDEFIVLCEALLNVLAQMTGGKHLSRKFLIEKCRHLLDTQNELKAIRSSKSSNGERHANVHLVSFLGGYGATGCDEFDDGDHPGGLWSGRERMEVCNDESRKSYSSPEQRPRQRSDGKKHKSWAISYTEKVLADNDWIHPAYGQYRHGQLLARNSEDINRE